MNVPRERNEQTFHDALLTNGVRTVLMSAFRYLCPGIQGDAPDKDESVSGFGAPRCL
jgi:hypothetical protein